MMQMNQSKTNISGKHWPLLIILIICGLVISGCGSAATSGTAEAPSGTGQSATTPNGDAADDLFTFTYQSVKIAPFALADQVIDDLGEAMSYFEAESCAFAGLDKIYTYSSFEISTVPEGGEDHISLIVLLDDTVATEEGIRIGSTREDVIEAYGDEYELQGTALAYHRGESILLFLMEEDMVAAIEYVADYGV